MPNSVSPSACKNETTGFSPSTRVRRPAGITISLNCMPGARLSLPSSPSADSASGVIVASGDLRRASAPGLQEGYRDGRPSASGWARR